jgi:hypothetical protein
VGHVICTIPGSCLYTKHITRRRKCNTSDCFFFHSSSTYLYAPIVVRIDTRDGSLQSECKSVCATIEKKNTS